MLFLDYVRMWKLVEHMRAERDRDAALSELRAYAASFPSSPFSRTAL